MLFNLWIPQWLYLLKISKPNSVGTWKHVQGNSFGITMQVRWTAPVCLYLFVAVHMWLVLWHEGELTGWALYNKITFLKPLVHTRVIYSSLWYGLAANVHNSCGREQRTICIVHPRPVYRGQNLLHTESAEICTWVTPNRLSETSTEKLAAHGTFVFHMSNDPWWPLTSL